MDIPILYPRKTIKNDSFLQKKTQELIYGVLKPLNYWVTGNIGGAEGP